MKIKLFAILILCIMILFMAAGCTKHTSDYEPANKDSKSDSIDSKPNSQDTVNSSVVLKIDSTDLKTVSNQIMLKFFDSCKNDSVAKIHQITDYIINNIYNFQGNSDKFSFSIIYSVKPVDIKKSTWLSGNGEIKEDGWIVNKYSFVDVQKTDNTYTIVNMGTSK